jgi:NADH-ubiquinone oxidoreductase chain 5
MVIAGLAAFVERDLKKIIAYSTLSQLGVIIMALGLGSPLLALFHLLSHALFKALMFVCAGVFIHYHWHRQDVRLIGGLGKIFPVTQLGMVVSNLALCGFPFLSGFYSKDPIYEIRVLGAARWFPIFFTVFGLFLTRAYSFRRLRFSQLGEINQVALRCFGNRAVYFTLPVYLLGAGAISWGGVLNWILLPSTFLGPVSFMYGVVPVLLFVSVFGLRFVFNRGIGVDLMP